MKKIIYKLKDQFGTIHKLDLNSYDDKLGTSPEQSFFIFGLLRQSKTNKVIFWNDDEEGEGWNPKTKRTDGYIEIAHIGIEDVRGALESIDKDFYTYIGSTKSKIMSLLPKNKAYLTGIIYSLNNWNGYFYK